ncbi:amino acid transporter [Basidiobolus meristosporus CBS 931.73]|uniref:Amino acid transporter n=1 Tax=Basidiobolus meristosporus CBS 931.73 TaxID=1314790 RepID=A0A1Y1XVV8_9FUNG|nr:amino acid transporter [Basidiobolus meristosporus CBS 931.73]|eukprot:ORX89891.1 amino acid transporter [Basidiobolus meristosporus CBS 931.73]
MQDISTDEKHEVDHADEKHQHPNLEGGDLKRNLKSRHLSMIAIGGTIGTGLFLGSGGSIAKAGPGGALVAYGLIGIMVFFLMTSLGEMAAYMPVSGSFNTYASRFVDPALGFALGWNYWLSWAITVAAELAAAAVIMKFWLPDFPSWVWSLLLLTIMVGFNALSVKGYGESEYWFALIKILTVVVFIVVGVVFLCTRKGADAELHGPSNFTYNEAPFVNGFVGVLEVFLIAGFSFQGTEIVGVTAGESSNPEKDVPRAVKQVFWRILLFYICAITVIGLIIRYDDVRLSSSDVESISTSPFTLVFLMIGFKPATHMMNAIVLLTLLSAGNSGLYAATRTLWVLANEDKGPKFLKKVSSNGIPLWALGFTALISCLSFTTSTFGEGVVYEWLLNASGITGFVGWFGIAVSHYRFRKAFLAQGNQLSQLPYTAMFYPYGPLFALVLIVIVIIGQGYSGFTSDPIDWMQLLASYLGLLIFIVLYIAFKLIKKTKLVPLLECDLSLIPPEFHSDEVDANACSITIFAPRLKLTKLRLDHECLIRLANHEL